MGKHSINKLMNVPAARVLQCHETRKKKEKEEDAKEEKKEAKENCTANREKNSAIINHRV